MPLNLVSSYKVFSARRVSILTRNPNIGFPSVRPSVCSVLVILSKQMLSGSNIFETSPFMLTAFDL